MQVHFVRSFWSECQLEPHHLCTGGYYVLLISVVICVAIQ
jgi:hypothetical protein